MDGAEQTDKTQAELASGLLSVPWEEFQGFPFFYEEIGIKPDRLPDGRRLRAGVSANGDAIYVWVGDRQYAVGTGAIIGELIQVVTAEEPASATAEEGS